MAPGSRALLYVTLAALALAPLPHARAEEPLQTPPPPSTAAAVAPVSPVGGLRPAEETGSSTEAMDQADPLAKVPETPPKTSATKPKPKKKTGQLPPLRSYKRVDNPAQLRGAQGVVDPADPAIQPPTPTTAVIPAPPPRRKIPVDDDPFQPLGVGVGNLRLLPYLEEDLGYNSNPLSGQAAKGSWSSTTEAGVSLKSDWSRDALTGELKAGYTDYFATPTGSAPYGSGKLDGRLDVSRDLSLDAEGRFNVADVSVSSLGLPAAAAGNATALLTQSTYGLTVGGERKFGQFTLALHGSLDRMDFQDVALAAPATGGLAGDDHDDWTLKTRAGYHVSEFIQPFLELDLDERRYGGGLDVLGYQRDSTGTAGLAGVSLGFSQKLTGEVSVGYGERKYQDARLASAAAPLVNTSLVWSPTALTTLTLKSQTQLMDAIDSAASADISRSYSIDLSHSLTRQIMLGLNGLYATDNYVGASQSDRSWTVGARAEYHLNRDVVLKASASHTAYVSTLPGSNYAANVFLLGVRLQR